MADYSYYFECGCSYYTGCRCKQIEEERKEAEFLAGKGFKKVLTGGSQYEHKRVYGFECLSCSSVVKNVDKHLEWHEELARPRRNWLGSPL